MSKSRVFGGRVDDIDVQVEKLHRLIEGAARHDPELAAGMATTESVGNVQRKLDQAAASCEDVEHHLRDVIRNRETGVKQRR
jgi:hypothetical protein